MSDDEYVPSDHSAEAGPSGSAARVHPLPRTTFRSIEYPGPMQRPEQILKHVLQEDIDEVFNAPMSDPRQLELRYRPHLRAAVPVRGNRVASQKVLVKITKRRKKARPGQAGQDGEEGAFTAEVLGNVPQTVRFRCTSSSCVERRKADASHGGLPVYAAGGYRDRAAYAGAC